MKRILKYIRKADYRHFISLSITAFFVFLTFWIFPDSLVRMSEAARDIVCSFGYYFNGLLQLEYDVPALVNELSSVDMSLSFPENFEVFKVSWSNYWDMFFTGENFVNYLILVLDILYNFSRFLLLIFIPLVLVFYLLFLRIFKKHNNDYNVDSKPLRKAKEFGDRVYLPVIRWFSSFKTFYAQHRRYVTFWLWIWCLNFNVITIAVEFVSFYLYFVVSYDFPSIFVQLYKLFSDLYVLIDFIPGWIWGFIALYVLNAIRHNIGYARLRRHENHNCGFVKDLPIVNLTCGTVGKKKTTMTTAMALLQEKMFRQDSLDIMLGLDMKFPNFPWVNLENALKDAKSKHQIYNLATYESYIKHLRFCFYESLRGDEDTVKTLKRHLRKKFGLTHNNFIFDYDYVRYGLEYFDELKVINVWDAILSYSKLYYIYTLKSSMIQSNYSVRLDGIVSDLGNLPMRDDDFYERDRMNYECNSFYANIIDFNATRLGKKLGDPEDPKKDSFEFGVVLITEGGKERKNNLQLQELKKNTDVANQKNDGFNDWLKMIRHSGTIEYHPFVKVFMDEQRPESWGADGRDLCDIIHIRDSGETKLVMPLFALEELLYSFVFGRFIKLYLRYRYVRSDNTLLMYIFKKIASKLYRYYNKVYNVFGYCKLDLQVERGTQDGELEDKYFFLDNKLVYSDRFSTDCFSEFFINKARRSKIGVEDLDKYKTSKATFEELQMQNSYFIADLMNKQENDK